MTRARVQIAVLRTEVGGGNKPIKRWRFVAHGAPYGRDEAESYVTEYGKANVRLLPLPRGM
jgi:hypothetical protein